MRGHAARPRFSYHVTRFTARSYSVRLPSASEHSVYRRPTHPLTDCPPFQDLRAGQPLSPASMSSTGVAGHRSFHWKNVIAPGDVPRDTSCSAGCPL